MGFGTKCRDHEAITHRDRGGVAAISACFGMRSCSFPEGRGVQVDGIDSHLPRSSSSHI